MKSTDAQQIVSNHNLIRDVRDERLANEFSTLMLMMLMHNTISDKIKCSTITGWYLSSYPYYRLNYYDEIQVSQVLGVYMLFSPEFLCRFDTIIEIGTYNGGFTLYLNDAKRSDTKLVSYDIDETLNTAKNLEAAKDIDFRIESCFSKKAKNDIISMIGEDKRVLLLCDGGNKTLEFNTFSKYLKSGDVIGIHDFKRDEEYYKFCTNYWQWPYGAESSLDDIQTSIKKFKLKEYTGTLAPFYFWGLYEKENVSPKNKTIKKSVKKKKIGKLL